MSQQRLRHSPALADLPHHVFGGHADVVEFHFVQAVVIVDRDDRVHLDTFTLHIDQDERNALLLLAGVIGAHQAENPVGVLGIRRPDLGAVDNEIIAIALCFGFETRQVRARSRLGVTLTPPIFTLENARQEIFFLLICPVGHDDVGDHHQTKRHHVRDAGKGSLGFVDVLLRCCPARAAVFRWPIGCNPAFVIKFSLPLLDGVFVIGRAQARLQFGCVGFIKEPAHFVAESQIFSGICCIHGSPRGRKGLPSTARATRF